MAAAGDCVMNSQRFNKIWLAAAIASVVLPALQLRAQTAAKTFPSPQAAADALVAAAEKFDVGSLEQIFGADGRDIIVTGEPVRDREITSDFVAQARGQK